MFNILVSDMVKISLTYIEFEEKLSQKFPGPWRHMNSEQTYLFYLLVFNSISHARVIQNSIFLRFSLESLYLFSHTHDFQMFSPSYTHKFANRSRSPLSTTSLTRQSPLNLLIQLLQYVQFKYPYFLRISRNSRIKKGVAPPTMTKNKGWPA